MATGVVELYPWWRLLACITQLGHLTASIDESISFQGLTNLIHRHQLYMNKVRLQSRRDAMSQPHS